MLDRTIEVAGNQERALHVFGQVSCFHELNVHRLGGGATHQSIDGFHFQGIGRRYHRRRRIVQLLVIPLQIHFAKATKGDAPGIIR